MMVVSVMHHEQHQVLMGLLLLRKTRGLPYNATISRPQTGVDSFDGLCETLADQVLVVGQNGLERTPVITAVPHHVQMFDQAIEPFDRLGIALAPDEGQDFIGLLGIGIEEPTLVRLPRTDEGPELVEYDPIIVFLQGIDDQLIGLSPETACHGLGTHAEDIGTVAEATAASEHVQRLAL